MRPVTALRRRSRAHEGGQALPEFALVAPLFFLLVFAVIELGIIFGGQNGLVNAAREFNRYAAPYRVTTDVDATNVCADARLGTALTNAMRLAIPGFDSANIGARQVTYSWHAYPNGSTYYVQMQIHVSYHFPLYVPLVGGLIDGFDGISDGKFLLDATESMRIENNDIDQTYADVTCTI